MQPAALAAKG